MNRYHDDQVPGDASDTSNTPEGVEALMALIKETVNAAGQHRFAAVADGYDRIRTALESLAGGAQPVAWGRETAGGIQVCYMQEEPPADPPWRHVRSDAKWIPLYTHPPLSAGEAVAQPVVYQGIIMGARWPGLWMVGRRVLGSGGPWEYWSIGLGWGPEEQADVYRHDDACAAYDQHFPAPLPASPHAPVGENKE